MSGFWQTVYYGGALPVAEGYARLVSPWNRKIAAGLTGRRLPEAMEKGQGGPRFWFHASSLGEFEQARPIIEKLAQRYPSQRVWVSFFSPSGLESLHDHRDFVDCFYLPFHRRALHRALDRIRPAMVVVVKTDLWPGLVWEAAACGCPVALVDGTLTASSLKNLKLGRSFHRSYYGKLSMVTAVADADAERLRALCGASVPITVAGDSKFDRMWNRMQNAASAEWLGPLISGRSPLLVAGSTYDQEERVISLALTQMQNASDRMSVLLVPHEPTEERLTRAEMLFSGQGWKVRRASDAKEGDEWNILLLDRVGILAEAYRYADMVLVGGSYKAKVHNVVEPAMWGKPIIVGPYNTNSPEAMEMIANGSVIQASNHEELKAVLSTWLETPEAAQTVGDKAGEYADSRRGASSRIADAIERHMPSLHSTELS